MQIVSELIDIPNNGNPSTEYIEKELTKRNIKPLRWAVVHVDDKILSNSEEARARNARMIALTDSDDTKLNELFDYIIRIPEISEILSPALAVVPLQLLAYYIAEFLGKDVDQPRNLAKSVTVE